MLSTIDLRIWHKQFQRVTPRYDHEQWVTAVITQRDGLPGEVGCVRASGIVSDGVVVPDSCSLKSRIWTVIDIAVTTFI